MTFGYLKSAPPSSESPPHPLATLPREDLDLITELVLQGGSLKDLATAYGVSYPTIRARVDRTIQRLRDAVQGRKPDPLSELLAALVERGELTVGGARSVRDFLRNQPSSTPPPPFPQNASAPGANP